MNKHNRRFSRALVAGVGVLLVSTALAACGSDAETAALGDTSDWDSVVAAAKDEGKVVYYHSGDLAQGQLIEKAFEKEYPEIDLQMAKGNKDLFARVEAEIKSGVDGADVYLTADELWYLDHKGEYLPMDGPHAEDIESDAWVIPDEVATVHKSPYSVFVWNTKTFPDGFKSWDELIDPRAKGKMAFRGDAASKSAAGYLDFLASKFGKEYLDKLAAQDPKLYPSVVPATQAVGSGEAGMTPASLPATVSELKTSGAPIDSFIPDDGYGIGFQVAALKNAHRPNAAVVLTDFLLSPEGQEALNGDGQGGAVIPDVPGSVDMSKFTMLDASKYDEETTAKWQAWVDEHLT